MAKFIGKQSDFNWFTGVVEDRFDPLFAGRIRVRCLGYHTENKSSLPTADLPWAICLNGSGSPSISGIGFSPSFYLNGTWVWGYFRDEECQEPVILGSLPGIPEEYGNPGRGFSDPDIRPSLTVRNGNYGPGAEIIPKEEDGEPEVSIYPRNIGESDVNRLAVNLKDSEGNEILPHSSLTSRRAARLSEIAPFYPIEIATADYNSMTTAAGDTTLPSDGTVWYQPEVPYAAVYPHNHVYESESGHLQEFDDSFTYDENGNRIGHERIHISHRTGTSIELHPDGTRTDLIKKDSYTLTTGNQFVYIQGKSDTTLNGRHKLYINKNGELNNHYDIQIGPGANVNIQVDSGDINLHTLTGRINMNSGGDANLKVGGDLNIEVAGSYNSTVSGNTTENTSGAVTIRGSTIDLNP